MGSDVGAVVLPAIALLVGAFAPQAYAHADAAADLHPAPFGWTLTLALLLATSAVLYAVGVRRLWRRAGPRRGVRGADVLRFALGWSTLAAALFSPIDALADRSFALHMLQHELLMLVAAPLLVLARPLEAWTWALPAGLRRRIARMVQGRTVKRAWRLCTSQSGAWSLHAAALWIWHMPLLFIAAIADTSLHVLQHACFLVTALLFWWSVLGQRAASHGLGAMASAFTTMLHTGALGALLTLAPQPWYVASTQPVLLGLTALEDQQLGGLIMWVPGSIAYLVAGLVIVAGWLSPARVRHDAA